ncbi:hypothetical protein Pan258_53210 [Symmachiella dynata]|uniref:ArnT family glycosyltransferase n=1 Tax=Symmachiella dynata TaxID=2527995 RepID=UPI00118CD71E|nr:glycosyltransferase family 39 protein [Symmachiella dynata]QDT51232.1 hypothetical protein Pan258_53210 [Symmachiella dynata]
MAAPDDNVATTQPAGDAQTARTRWPLLQRIPIGGIVVSIVVMLLMGITVRDYGLTTDEPIYILNTHRFIDWTADLFQQGPSVAFEDERLREGIYFARSDSKNLPATTLIAALGYVTVGQFDSAPAAYRWGNVIVFAITCGVVFQWIRRELSYGAAMIAVLALLGTPRLFANAHFLNIDTLVGCFWVLAAWALYYSRENWRWSIGFALFCGVGMMTKPTFWFALPWFCVWGLFYHRRELWRAAVCLVTVTPFTALLLIPLWWSNPVGGFFDYIALLRQEENGWQIDAFYLGDVYQMTGMPPVPWHSVIVLPLVTTPIWILVLAAVGLVHWLRRERTSDLLGLWVGSSVVLPLIVMLPSTPAHDGVRLYRASFFFLALIAAYGFQTLSDHWLKRTDQSSDSTRSRWEWAAIAALAAVAVWPLWRMHPGQLSYYNLAVGGLHGAATPQEVSSLPGNFKRPQFEIDYWWAAMNEPAWAEMQQQLPQGAKLWVFPEHFGLERLQEWEDLRQDITIVGPDQAQYLLLYGRLGRLLDPRSGNLGRLFLEGQPLWELRIDGVRVAALFRL